MSHRRAMRVFADVLCVCTLSVAGAPVDVEGVGEDESEHDDGTQD